MRGALAWSAIGLLGVAGQAMLVAGFGSGWVPDLSLLAVIAAALVLGPSEGLIVACVLGFGADMVSGSPLGQHAFVRVIELTVVRGFAGQLDLRRVVPQAVLGFAVSLLDSALLAGVSFLFVPTFAVAWSELGGLVARAAVTGLAAPAVGSLARTVIEWLSETEGRREMRLETRRPVL